VTWRALRASRQGGAALPEPTPADGG